MCSIASLLCFHHSQKKGTNKQKRAESDQNVLFSPSSATPNGKLERRLRRRIPPRGSAERLLFVNSRINMQICGSRHRLISCVYRHTEEIQQVRQERGAFFSTSEQTVVWQHALPTACMSWSVSNYGIIDQSCQNPLWNFKQLLSFQPLVGTVRQKKKEEKLHIA